MITVRHEVARNLLHEWSQALDSRTDLVIRPPKTTAHISEWAHKGYWPFHHLSLLHPPWSQLSEIILVFSSDYTWDPRPRCLHLHLFLPSDLCCVYKPKTVTRKQYLSNTYMLIIDAELFLKIPLQKKHIITKRNPWVLANSMFREHLKSYFIDLSG